MKLVNRILFPILAVSMATSGTAGAFTFKEKPSRALSKANGNNIELDVSNTVVLRGEVTDQSISNLIRDLENVKEDEVVLYIQSPGGSVVAGMKAISYIRATPKHVICLADVAISMAFVILQACDERVSTSSSITMQHVTSYGLSNQQAPNAESFVRFLTRMTEQMDIEQAKRIGLSYNNFKAKTRSDWWSFGEDVALEHVTDRTVNVTCTQKALKGVIETKVSTMMGSFNVSWSQCPVISEPVAVATSMIGIDPATSYAFEKSLNVRDTVLHLLGDIQ